MTLIFNNDKFYYNHLISNSQKRSEKMGKRRKKKTKRTCLRCDKEFMSEGIYNRICHSCREANTNIAIPTRADQEIDYYLQTNRDSLNTKNKIPNDDF